MTTTTSTLRAGTWQVDATTTRAAFTVGNLGSTVPGIVPVRSGEVEVDQSGVPRRLVGVLDLAGIDTGNARRDRDLRKPRLLDLDAHPSLTFVSERIESDDGGWTAHGTITARGSSCPLTLRCTVAGPAREDGAVQVQATAVLDRRELGLRVPRLVIGREVTITVDAWLSPADQRA